MQQVMQIMQLMQVITQAKQVMQHIMQAKQAMQVIMQLKQVIMHQMLHPLQDVLQYQITCIMQVKLCLFSNFMMQQVMCS